MYRDIKGYESLYSVDENGNVWTHEKAVKVGNNGGVVKRGGHLLKTMPNNKRTPHLRVILVKDGKRKQHQVHRLVALAFIPNPNNLPFVNHKDCDPTNNHVSNLEWCSAKENSVHAYKQGRWTPPNQKGSANSNCVFVDDDIKCIRELHKTLVNCAEIARQYKVNPKTINDIVHRKRWAHI